MNIIDRYVIWKMKCQIERELVKDLHRALIIAKAFNVDGWQSSTQLINDINGLLNMVRFKRQSQAFVNETMMEEATRQHATYADYYDRAHRRTGTYSAGPG